jgi:hypothetical protein
LTANHRAARRCSSANAQQLHEHRVVAVPPPVVIERDQERVGALQPLEHLRAVVAAGERIRKSRLKLIDHAGTQHELADVRGLLVQHLLDQIVGHRALVAGKCLHEPVRVRVVMQRQRGQGQTAGPAFGALVQLVDLLLT